jgi:nitrogen fixation protein FixH
MKRGAGWPMAVTAILGLTVAANIWLIRIASNDPSFAVEENYYQRGVRWDEELAQRARNRALGWKLVARMSPTDSGRRAILHVGLTDSTVRPVEGASVVVKAMHIARARHPMEVMLTTSAPGEYEALVPVERVGWWELRIDVHRGRERFTATERLELPAVHP